MNLRKARDLARTALGRLVTLLPDGAKLEIRERAQIRGRLDYGKADLELVVETPTELHNRLSSCAKEPETVAWLEENLREGDAFYDVGANVGAYSLVAAVNPRSGVRVVAFEPGFANYTQLCRNVFLNGLQDKITALPLALGGAMGLEVMRFSTTTPGAASHDWLSGGGPLGARDQRILVMPLDDVVARLGLPSPNLLKIDVDGFEGEVLRGGERTLENTALRTVLLEISGFGSPEQDPLVSRLGAFGFRVERVFPRQGACNVLFRRSSP
jgi:FkbM family methyltransferase